MAYFLYRYLMYVISLAAYGAGLLNAKLNRRNQGLRNQVIPHLDSCIWVHCASLGEFEQGKVLIDELRLKHPGKKLVLTFFSASGYEKKKNYKQVDHVLYLPYDTPVLMTSTVKSLQPELVVFVKYEFWFTLLDLLGKRQIPFVFVSSVFRPDQYLFRKAYRSLLDRILQASHIFVQNQSSLELLHAHNYSFVSAAGDTRIDRVIELKNQDFSWPSLEQWIGGATCVIAGSTWPEEEKLLAPLVPSYHDWKWIIAPHEITEHRNEKLKLLLGERAVFLSDIGGMDAAIPDYKQVLVIDRIGLLSKLYRYGDIAYIGGGMGAGIHNTLEPAVYGLSLFYGPEYEKFQEASDFYGMGAARVVRSTDDMMAALNYYDDEVRRQRIAKILKSYFEKYSGATENIMERIEILISNG